MANLRIKFGRKVVEPGYADAQIEHNNRYIDYFDAKFENFEDREGNEISMPYVYCKDIEGFLSKVEENRAAAAPQENLGAVRRGKKRKLGGDSGKGTLKMCMSLFDDNERPPAKKAKRFSYEDGIGGGKAAEETGQGKMLCLAVVPTIPESPYNIRKMLNSLKLDQMDFQITGDLKFLMPCYGLKGCSSLHPCLFCCQMRRKGVWSGPPDLRTFANLAEQVEKLPEDPGRRNKTAVTAGTQSVVGDVLVRTAWDADDKTVLSKTGMPSVHLLLATNDVLNFCEPFFGGRQAMLGFLKTHLSIQPHSYQGHEGAFAGPECDKILNNLNIIEPQLRNGGANGGLIFNLLTSFQKVKKDIFGTELGNTWEASIQEFSEDLDIAHAAASLPISPKLHIIQKHVAQKVYMTGRALGKENEAALEAYHGSYLKVWDYYHVRDKHSPVYLDHLLKSVLRINRDNT